MHAEVLKLIVEASMMLLVLGVGLQSSRSELAYILGHSALIVRGMIAVNVVVPLAAILLCLILPLDRPTKAGIVVMAVSPLCPLVLAKMLHAGAERSHVVGVYVVLILASILIVPLTVEVLGLSLGRDFSSPVGDVIALVTITVLLPLAAGILVASRWPRLAMRAATWATILAYFLLWPVLFLVAFRAGGEILAQLGNGTLLVIILTILSGFAAGHALGGPTPEYRLALAQAAATRHPAIASLIASANFGDRDVKLTVFLFMFVGMLMSFLYARWFTKRFRLSHAVHGRAG